MYITRDYLKVGSWQAIIDMINDKYNFQLQPGIVKLKAMTPLSSKRTQIEIIPNRSTNPINLMPPITQTVFTYDRLNLTEFFRNTIAVNVIGLTLPITTFDILEQLGLQNEIVFEVDDFIHQTFDKYSLPIDNDIILEADSRSLRFVGHLRIRLINTSQLNLSTLPNLNVEFPNITPKPDLTKIRGDYYVSRYDFTLYRDELKSIPVGLYHKPEQLLGPLYRTTGIQFQASAIAKPLNIVHSLVQGEPHCKVLYNGAAITKWTSRIEFRRVLVIELSDLATGINGFLRLHYD